jgi:hypothetical protein
VGEQVEGAHLLIHASEIQDHTIRKTEASCRKEEGGGVQKVTEKSRRKGGISRGGMRRRDQLWTSLRIKGL